MEFLPEPLSISFAYTSHTLYQLPLPPHGLHGGYWLAWVSKLSKCLACVTGTPLIIKSTNDKKERDFYSMHGENNGGLV